MKKLYIIIISLISFNAFSQKDYSRYYNSWRLGLNLGGAWQTADYRSCWGMAGGITLEKGFHENGTNFFSFTIRGRYLGANTYGMDYNRNYDVKGNDAYNGKYDGNVNFVDSVSIGKQYVYDNYKMTLGEGSLELQLTFNRLRERTHVLLNLWGGIGITSYRAKSDLLDGNGKMYDFSLVDSTGSKTKALNSYNGIIDKKYESFAYGSKNGNLVTFSPSLGIGLGYQFSPGFSMLWEYKITFPKGTNADLLDGKLGTNKDAVAGSNDYYHYTGLNLVFTLRGKHKTTPPKEETVYTNTVVPTNTIIVPTNSITPTNSVVIITPTVSTEPKPFITFVTPAINGSVVNVQQYKISAQILNITNANQIQFKFNGVSYSNFSFNTQDHILEFNANLNIGNNTIQIIATNAGNDNKSTSIIYDLPKPIGSPPIVTYINPVQPGFVSASQSYVVKAQVLNVTSQSGISVYYNGMSIPFVFNASTKQVTFTINLNIGSNSVSITANNLIGEETKVTEVVFKTGKIQGVPPVVSLINPATQLNSADNLLYNFKLGVLNVNTKADIEVLFNGVAQTNYTYNSTTKEIDFQSGLVVGNNTLSVKGTNQFGTDIKQITVSYTPQLATKRPPVVTIKSPLNATTTTSISNYDFKANITNVPNASGLTVKFNGNVVTNYMYDGANLTYPAILIQGNNSFEVKAINNSGSDIKNGFVNYKIKVAAILPVVNLIDPATAINATNNIVYDFKLAVLNVNTRADIEVLFNGVAQTNFTYNTNSKEIDFQANLITGNNSLSVKGTNQFGFDTKQVNVNYTPQIVLKNPPAVTINNPVGVTINTSIPNYIFKARITNVPNTSGLVVKYNGIAITNYTYDGLNLSYPATLIQGNNSFEVTATNNDGSDIKDAFVNYKIKVAAILPVVNLINPANAIDATDNLVYDFKLSVLNVNTKSDIVLLFNGMAQTNFTYNTNSKEVDFQTNLIIGNNSLSVKGINQFGFDIKQLSVNYRPHVKISPVVTFVNPNSMTSTSPNINYLFTASITNVPSTSGLKVIFNEALITNYTYDGANLTYNGTLLSGDNFFSITATNNDGVDSKNVTVNYLPKAVAKPPVVTILQPAHSPTVNVAPFNFQFKVLNVSQNQIEVTFNGTITTFNFAAPLGNFSSDLIPGQNILSVKASNNDGIVTKTAKVTYISFKDTAAVNTNTDTPTTATRTPESTTTNSTSLSNTSNTIVICHVLENNQNPQTITIPVSVLAIHTAHGDKIGECLTKTDSLQVNPTPVIDIPDKSDQPVKDTLNRQPIITPRRPR